MIRLDARRINASTVGDYSWYSDLVYFDGPLICLFRGSGYKDALYVWLDNSERANRWCLIPVSRSTLDSYLNQRMSLREIIQSSEYTYICNHYAETGRKNYSILHVDSFPDEYMPDEDSYLYEEICTDDALLLKQERTSSYMLGLDNQLFINDLSVIPKVFEQLYSFHYGLAHLGRLSIRNTMLRLMGNWTGGISAVNIFSGLKSVIPVLHRPEISSLQYNSPGHIELNLLPDLAQSVQDASVRVENELIYDRLEKMYKNTYTYFREHGLSGFDEDGGIEIRNIDNDTTENLRKRVRIFFRCLGWSSYQAQFDLIGTHPLQQLRAVMAYYRRLKILREYIISEKLFVGQSRVLQQPQIALPPEV